MNLPMRRCMVVMAASVVIASVHFAAFSQEQAEYVGNTTCKLCHNREADGAQWTKWKAMKHAQAYETLLTDKAKEVATKVGVTTPPSESPECLKCHVTAYKAPDKPAAPGSTAEISLPDKISKEDGVQCESCHGPASLHVADGKKFKITKDASIDMGAHINKPGEADCLKCHNKDNPTYDPNRYTLADGTKADFDFKQAWAKIAHDFPPKTEAKTE